MTGVFDAIDLYDGAGNLVATVQRTGGSPLEDGMLDNTGTWHPDQAIDRVYAPGFGVDGQGPYFDTIDADPDEAATLLVESSTGAIYLEV